STSGRQARCCCRVPRWPAARPSSAGTLVGRTASDSIKIDKYRGIVTSSALTSIGSKVCGAHWFLFSSDKLHDVPLHGTRSVEMAAGVDVRFSPRTDHRPFGTGQAPFSRGGPIRAGWNNTAAAMVHSSARAINLPMLEVPGWLDIHRLPNA